MTSALQTDHYELTMLSAALRTGVAHRRAVFEVFGRKLPPGRAYGVFGGLGRLLDEIDRFRFGAEELAFLRRSGFDDATLDWLAGYRFGGDVVAYREGELYFPFSPVLTVEASFGEAVVLETLVLSVLNHDTAVAAAAARMVAVAEGRPLLEMGGRRTHEDAAVSAARAAYLVGFDATSNLEAGRRYGVPTRGTAAHAFTLAHATEEEAFASQLDSAGVGTTILVDTYDIATAIRTAVRLANERGATGPGAIRIDSGDLHDEATRARALLDDLGAADTRIVVSGDLDEYLIEDLLERRAPIDSFGVGTKVVTGSGHPTANFVYKLVAIAADDDPASPLRPVAKKSSGKISVGGRKAAWRVVDDGGQAVEERFEVLDGPWDDPPLPEGLRGRPLQILAVCDGDRRYRPTNEEVRSHHEAARMELRPLDRMIVAAPPALVARPVPRSSPMKRALLVVDTQPTFCEGGGLPVAGGDAAAARIGAYLATAVGDGHYDEIVASQDWHIAPGDHWAPEGTTPDFATTWPRHGPAGEPEADLHPALLAAVGADPGTVPPVFTGLVRKGMHAAAYSAFDGVVVDDVDAREPTGVPLAGWLRDRGITDVDVCGIATDYCDRATALDAVAAGFSVRLLVDLTAGVAEATTAAALEELATAGVAIVRSAEVMA